MSPRETLHFASDRPSKHENLLRVRAARIIPGGSSTGSKRPAVLYGSHEHDTELPTHYVRAHGCTLIADDGRSYVDCSMALGAVAIGYADDAITRAVQDAAAAGNVSGLPPLLEIEVAERSLRSFRARSRCGFFAQVRRRRPQRFGWPASRRIVRTSWRVAISAGWIGAVTPRVYRRT